jgi:iron complex transport system ATP-binding protein
LVQNGLAAREVVVRVGARTLLDGVSIELAPGEVVALAGPNGAGKSTLLRALAGELAPSGGEVLLDGRPLRSYRARDLALRRAVLPQQTLLQFAFSAREVVAMGRHPHVARGGDPERDEMAIDGAMAKTETTELAERAYPSLSGGEQGRVSLARVLAQEAPIILLDEPTAALDLRHQQATLAVARELADGGATVLAVLHDLNLAATYADRIALLAAGRLVACGRPWDVLTAEILSGVFGHPIMIVPHPAHDSPLVIPLPRVPARAAVTPAGR